MRLTSNEQSIIKCICNAPSSATRHHIVVYTGLHPSVADKTLGILITCGQVVLQQDGSFGLTPLAKGNPVVKFMLQEKEEERLWMEGNPHRQQYRLISRFKSIVYYCLQIHN